MTTKQENSEPGRELMPLLHAVQYYVTGRYAALCSFVPVVGVLFHHAAEMFLKAEILKLRTDLDDACADSYLKREFGHDLAKLWVAVKSAHPDAGLDEFDATIIRLNKFEDVRYPQLDIFTIVTLTFQPVDGPILGAPAGHKGRQVQISLDEIDALFARLWSVCAMPIAPLKGYQDSAPFVETMYQCFNKTPVYEQTVDMYFRKR